MRPREPPLYADPEKFTEQDVRVGDGPLAVDGTMSLPRHGRPVPGVVLLVGLGPHDFPGSGRPRPPSTSLPSTWIPRSSPPSRTG